VNIETLAEESAHDLAMNGIGLAEIVTAKALFFDAYEVNRITGSFILIDPETNATSGAGMIRDLVDGHARGPVSRAERIARWGHRGAVIQVRTMRRALVLERALFDRGCAVAAVDSEASAEVLARAGMLAIRPVWSARDDEIAEILSDLERQGILGGHHFGSPGEGI